jgi:hypothetical protein
MALSMEEQRILAEIEQNLARAEPALATRLARLEHPRPTVTGVLRSPRGRLLASLAALATLLLMSMLVYLLISLRGIPQRGENGRPAATTAPRSPGTSAQRTPPPARFSPGKANQAKGAPG